MKRLKKKGEPFEELTVVKSAGFEKGKRRDKSINKKAGLHDKKTAEDQTRVYRRKPLAVKHKRRLRKALPALLALISIAMVIIISGSYMPPVNFDDLDGDYRTVCFETPDNSSPEEHTVVETIGYLNYTLQNQTYWASEMEQTLSAMFNIKQSTYNYKKYYNKALISVDIAKGASTSARQFCQTDKVVLWRDAVDVNSTNGFYTNWQTGQPAGLTVGEFRKKRGLPPAEFSVYVLNENTILNAQDTGVVNNGDGTYSVTADLNVNTKGGEENDMCSAVYYYKQQMAVTGGLSQLPTYEYTNVTYVFDENYRVLSFEIHDKYEATLRIAGLGEVTSGCTSTTKTVFSYEMEDCVNSVYDDFKPYLNNFGDAQDEEPAFSVSATNCLAGAFASVLSDGAVFKLDLGLGGKTVDGVVGVALKDGGLDSVALQLGNITAHILSEQNGYGVYLALGQNKYKIMLGELNLSKASENTELPAADGEGDLLSDLLDSLLGGDFAYDSQSGLATLNSDISLFGIDININFAFSVDEEQEEISLIDVKANIKYGNIGLDATLKFGDESDKPADLNPADKVLYKDILNDGIAVGVDLTLGDKVIKGVAKIDLSKGVFAGLRANLGEINVHYDGASLYISSGDSKYKLGLDALGGSVGLPVGVDFDLTSLLSDILENLTIENGIIKAQIFDADIAIDLLEGIKVSAYYDAFGGIGVDAYLSNSSAPAQLTEQDKATYTDILNDGVTVGVSLTLGDKVITGVAKIDLLDGNFVGLRAKLGEITVHYDGANLYISSGDSKYKLGLDALGGSVGLPVGVDFDITSLLSDILENLTIENGIIKAQILDLDISVDLFEGIKVSAYYDAFGGIGVDAYLSTDPVPAQLTEQDKATYTDILNDGVTVGVDLTLGDKVITGVAKIDLLDGNFAGLRAKLGEITVHYDGASLYISSGDSKYKLGLEALGGSAVLPTGLNFDLTSLLSDILENLTIENGIIKSHIFDADIAIDLFEGIKVSAYYDAFGGIGVDAYLSTDPVPAQLTEQDKATYTDILNDGVTVGVDLTLGDKVIKGVAKIDLLDGNFVGLRAKLGEITVHYDGANLYISSGDSKYKLDLEALGGSVGLPVGVDFDITSLLSDILENLTIENGIIKSQILDLDISVDLFEGIKVSAYYDAFGGIGVDAYLSNSSAPAQLTEIDKANYTDILNDGVTVGVDLTLDGKLINGVAKIDLSNGEFAGLRAKLGDAVVHYEGDILYISVSGSKIKLPLSAFGGATVNTDGFNLNGLIKDIVNGVHIENGIINTELFGADISLDIFGGIKADVLYEIFNAKIKASATLLSGGAPARLSADEKNGYVDVTEGFSLSGMLGVTLGGEQISLVVNNLAVSFENSFGFKLDTTLLLNNTYNNFYIEYTDDVLTVTYGTVHSAGEDGEEGVLDAVTVKLDIGNGDLDALGEVIVTIYNRVIAVYNEIAKQNVQAANGLQDILDMLGIAQDGIEGMSEIFEKLALPVKDGKLDMQTLLKSIAISSTQNGISVTLGNIFAELALKGSGVSCGANIRFGTSSFDLTIADVTVNKYCDFEVPCENPLDKDGFVDMLDFLGATAEMLLQHTITLNLAGTIYNYNGQYTDYGDVKYKFNAFLEYDDGGSMPVTFEDGQLYVSNDLYLHAKLDLIAQNTDADESLYLDVYILDGHPNDTDDNGFTKGGYTADGTGLDFYVSVSKLAEGASGYNPLKFYGSMNEVLSLGAMGAAMLNLQDVNTESEQVNSAVASIYALLDTMLIQNYIPSVKSQFESLGESLIPNILGSDLSTMLNKVIDSLEGLLNGSDNSDKELTEGNFIKKAICEDGRIDVALNSATLFGIPEYNDLTFYITKTAGEKALISSLGINNIYFNENGLNKLDFAATFDYSSKSRPDPSSAFKDYHNFAGIDDLLLMAVGSATHETTEEERAAGYFADYKLNNDYCVDGKIELKLNLDFGRLSIPIKTIPVTINALHINIDDDNNVSFDINLNYSKQTLIMSDSAHVDISIRNDMVYIRKSIDGGATSYRIMPVTSFTDDMFNQLAYVLSFSSTVTNLADQFMSKSTEKVFPTFSDYGDYISKFINTYTYDGSGNSSEWHFVLNGETLGGMAGMTGLSNIDIKFKGENGVLKTLTLDGALSVMQFSGTLNYLNPNEQFIAGKEDKSVNVANLVADGLYYSWADILGGDTFNEIDKHFKWSEVAGGNTGYLSYENGKLALSGSDYEYIGASCFVNGSYVIGTFEDLKKANAESANIQLIWVKAVIDISVNRGDSVGGSWLTGYTYPHTIIANEINVAFIGNEEVIKNMTITGDVYGYISNNTNHDGYSKGNEQFTSRQIINIDKYSNSSFSSGVITLVESGLVTKSKTYGHVAIDLSIVSANGYTFTASMHAYEKF